MNTPGNNSQLSTDDAIDNSVERILGNATPRPVPSTEEIRIVRDNVYDEWLTLTKKRRANRRLVSWSIAATIMVVLFAALNAIRLGGVSETQVASISRSFGSIYMLGENAELLENNNVSDVTVGQTIVTGEDAGIGFAWGEGGSLRIDENTRVQFLARDSIYLRSGRVYFDSKPSLITGASNGSARLTIVTDHGAVTHVGTQYMARADGNTLTITVREGEVRLENHGAIESAFGGQQLEIRGGTSVNVVNIKTYGENWQWIEQMSPAAMVDGRSVYDFLGWVSHETGLAVRFANDEVESSAMNEMLIGTVDTDPVTALRIWMLGVDMNWNIEDGVILVDRIVDGESQ